ncbi:MAG TPA: hypothetical protein VE953_16140 [Terriglobales bacterium]|nr:hypothetical protein [Terriglobales bacterium]
MMEYETAKARQEEIRRMVERNRLAIDALRSREPRRPLRQAVGTGLARLGLRLAGQTAIRSALGEAR